ncbi:MAG: ATP-binding protein [Alphaproteobacteria bacterium]
MFFKNYLLKDKIKKNTYFIWKSKNKSITPVENFKPLNLDLIIGVDNQKKKLFENTMNFAEGNFTNNALLWGARGNGKSSLIKSVFHKVLSKYNNLKLIQLNKSNIFDIEILYELIRKYYNFRFVIFIDDLSFEKIDSDYKIIKSTLDGSIQNQPNNILLYVSSNRRHLMPRDMIDNEKSSAIHTDESVEEKISLSDRFGLWIGFHKLSQKDYLKIIETYCNFYKINYNEEIKKKGIQWSLQRGNRTGRTAWQFILNTASEQNLKITF